MELDAMNKTPPPASVADCQLLAFPGHADERGLLTFVEGGRHVPFPIARVFTILQVPAGSSRGGHAHPVQRQVLICLHGAVSVDLFDGRQRRRFRLDDPHRGLLIEPMVWADLVDFAPATVVLALSSMPYDPGDYVRDMDEFVAMRRAP
jgi:dTDP-4-dehydrorhamnose 3,5-epimerase-like enzyme